MSGDIRDLKMTKIKLNEENVKEIVKMYKDDLLNFVEIGKQTGFSFRLIKKILNDEGINTSRSHKRKLLFEHGKIKQWCKGLTKETDEKMMLLSKKRKQLISKGIIDMSYLKGNENWKKRKDGSNKGKIELECQNCHKLFEVINSRNESKFCSRKCYKKAIPSWNQGLTVETSKSLKKAIDNRLKTVKRLINEGKWVVSDDTRKKISLKTAGKNNPMFNNWSSFEPYPPTFNNSFKRAIRKRDNYVCMKCLIHQEKLPRSLDVHHIDYIKENTFEQNCCALCNSCNLEVNQNRKHWTKFFQSLLAERYGYEYTPEGEAVIKIGEAKY
jgi:DNA-binding transcriptional MerR regulator